jgi:hypothetical protein
LFVFELGVINSEQTDTSEIFKGTELLLYSEIFCS